MIKSAGERAGRVGTANQSIRYRDRVWMNGYAGLRITTKAPTSTLS